MSSEANRARKDLIDSALHDFMDLWESGETPDVDTFCSAYPECGPGLRQVLDDYLFLERGLREAAIHFGKTPSSDDDEVTRLIGKRMGGYELLRPIGRGGMGLVFEAVQVSLNRNVAIKILPKCHAYAGASVSKFQREARAACMQRHPHIVMTFEVGQADGIHYIAQELVEGGRTLRDFLAESVERPAAPSKGYFRQVATLIERVACGLDHAHGLGVVHRDVKPANILLTRDLVPKIADFGLARIEGGEDLTLTGQIAGTPRYMSPEQAEGSKDRIGPGTDLFSLGATLYEALTWVRPFDSATEREILKGVCSTDPLDPRRRNPRVPRDLSVICMKALEKRPRDRYASMEEMAEDLRRFLDGKTILAQPAGPVTRLVKRARRHPAFSTAVGVAAIALITLFVYMPISLIRISKARDDTQKQLKKTEHALALSEERRLYALSQSLLAEPDVEPELPLRIALQAAQKRESPGWEANNALLAALQRFGVIESFPGFNGNPVSEKPPSLLMMGDPRHDRIILVAEGKKEAILRSMHGREKPGTLALPSAAVAMAKFDLFSWGRRWRSPASMVAPAGWTRTTRGEE